jgi:hypothetical protein
MVAAFLLLAAASPSPEALAVSRQIAETSDLVSLLPMIQAEETKELIEEHSELNEAEKSALRATSKRVFETGRERLIGAIAQAYADRMTVEELKSIVAFESSPAARRYRAVTPAAIQAAIQSIGEPDFKGDVLKAFCKETGKLCPKAK